MQLWKERAEKENNKEIQDPKKLDLILNLKHRMIYKYYPKKKCKLNKMAALQETLRKLTKLSWY